MKANGTIFWNSITKTFFENILEKMYAIRTTRTDVYVFGEKLDAHLINELWKIRPLAK
jgi:hypothetical protein